MHLLSSVNLQIIANCNIENSQIWKNKRTDFIPPFFTFKFITLYGRSSPFLLFPPLPKKWEWEWPRQLRMGMTFRNRNYILMKSHFLFWYDFFLFAFYLYIFSSNFILIFLILRKTLKLAGFNCFLSVKSII